MPCRVSAPALLEPDGAENVYASVPGRIVSACRVGERVAPGDTVALLQNDDLELEIARLAGQLDQQESQIKSLEARRGKDPEAAAELPIARQALDSIRSQLAARSEEAERLTLNASRHGIVLPPPGVSVARSRKQN